MDIDLGSDIEFNVKYRGQAYKMREPTTAETHALKDEQDKDQLAIVKFMTRLGLPEQVAKEMPLSKMRALAESIIGAISEKK